MLLVGSPTILQGVERHKKITDLAQHACISFAIEYRQAPGMALFQDGIEAEFRCRVDCLAKP